MIFIKLECAAAVPSKLGLYLLNVGYSLAAGLVCGVLAAWKPRGATEPIAETA